MRKRQWVSLMTMCNWDGKFYEEGGVYSDEPTNPAQEAARELNADESVVACSRCGQRFAGTDNETPERNRDMHFYGDEDSPSICRDMQPESTQEA